MDLTLIDPYALNLKVAAIVDLEARCLCPFHDDHKPSASFNMDMGIFHCYTCKASYNADQLALRLHGVVTRRPVTHKGLKGKSDWKWLLNLPLAYDNFYLSFRGVSNAQVQQFEIRDSGIGVAFPIYDRDGRIIGFQERRYDSEPRYVLHGNRAAIWPMASFRNYEKMFIVEGVFGVMRAQSFKINAVTTMSAGTIMEAGKVMSGRRPIVAFDDDYPGYFAMAKAATAFGWPGLAPGVESDELDENGWNTILEWHRPTTSIEAFANLSGQHDRLIGDIVAFNEKRARHERWTKAHRA